MSTSLKNTEEGMDKNLNNWIKEQKNAKVPKEDIKNALLSQGYSDKDIKKIFFETNIVYQFFNPTFIKLAIAILLLAVLLCSTIVNIIYIPEKAELITSMISDNYNISEQTKIINNQTKNPDVILNSLRNNEKIFKRTDENLKKMRENIEILAIPNIIVLAGQFYTIYPFYPEACEILFAVRSSAFTPNVNKVFCRYYSSEKIYDSLNSFLRADKYQILIGIEDDIPEYKKISFFEILVHSVLFFIVIYTLISFISFGFGKIISSSKLKTIISSIILGLIIIGIITFSIIATIFIQEQKTFDGEHSQTEYFLQNCTNEKIINDTLTNFEIREFSNETIKMCDNPDCSTICINSCKNSYLIIEGQGEKPYCICGCKQ
jgi:hypothetical protein